MRGEIRHATGSGLFWPRWLNLYGAPLGTTGEAADLMNRVASEGSTYRGRVLVRKRKTKKE